MTLHSTGKTRRTTEYFTYEVRSLICPVQGLRDAHRFKVNLMCGIQINFDANPIAKND